MSTLSNDIARCPGVGDDTEGWREEMGRELFPAAERLNSGAGGFLPVPLE